jgi:hypothetical protein
LKPDTEVKKLMGEMGDSTAPWHPTPTEQTKWRMNRSDSTVERTVALIEVYTEAAPRGKKTGWATVSGGKCMTAKDFCQLMRLSRKNGERYLRLAKKAGRIRWESGPGEPGRIGLTCRVQDHDKYLRINDGNCTGASDSPFFRLPTHIKSAVLRQPADWRRRFDAWLKAVTDLRPELEKQGIAAARKRHHELYYSGLRRLGFDMPEEKPEATEAKSTMLRVELEAVPDAVQVPDDMDPVQVPTPPKTAPVQKPAKRVHAPKTEPTPSKDTTAADPLLPATDRIPPRKELASEPAPESPEFQRKIGQYLTAIADAQRDSRTTVYREPRRQFGTPNPVTVENFTRLARTYQLSAAALRDAVVEILLSNSGFENWGGPYKALRAALQQRKEAAA